MNKISKEFIVFKYKNRVYHLFENNLSFRPGFRFKADGIVAISINKTLPQRKKQLELHRLITGRGLRDIRTKKRFRA